MTLTKFIRLGFLLAFFGIATTLGILMDSRFFYLYLGCTIAGVWAGSNDFHSSQTWWTYTRSMLRTGKAWVVVGGLLLLSFLMTGTYSLFVSLLMTFIMVGIWWCLFQSGGQAYWLAMRIRRDMPEPHGDEDPQLSSR
ncbi:hypothetical protein K2Q16_04275 [Patescibacteria group bacterium]|nr:hypothetical protein [Patescibacteria group bacterium]